MAGVVRHAHRPLAALFHHRCGDSLAYRDRRGRHEQQPRWPDESSDDVEERLKYIINIEAISILFGDIWKKLHVITL